MNLGHSPRADRRPERPPEPLWESIPRELFAFDQWVGWAFQVREGRPTKVPVQPNGAPASATNRETWSTFEHVQIAYQTHGFDGVGFVLTAADPFVAFDFDHIVDPATRLITDAKVRDWVIKLDSYTEVTPSGSGLRVIVRAALPGGDCRLGNYEVYCDKRYVTLTGDLYQKPQ